MNLNLMLKPININNINPLFIEHHDKNFQNIIEEEQLKVLKGISTDFVVEHYLTNELLNKFLNVVIRLFNIYIKEYIKINNLQQHDIKFIYKGGNVYRMFILQYLDLIPGVYSRKILKKYKDIMKRSDADFQIMINPLLNNYDKIFEDIEYLGFNVLDLIKKYFIYNNEKYFLFPRYKNSYKQEILQKLLNNLQKANDEYYNNHSTAFNYQFISIINGNDIFNNKYIPKSIEFIKDKYNNNQITKLQKNTFNLTSNHSDILIDIHNENHDNLNKGIDIFNLNSNKSNVFPLYNSLNKTIEIKISETNITKFSLARLKLNFVAIVKFNNKYGLLNLPGEFIDVSIPHKTSYEMLHSHDFTQILDEYNFKDNVNNEFSFESYNDKYYVENLEKMIYIDEMYPWNINKYTKRIKRYVLLLCLQTLKSNNSTQELNYMIKIRDSLKINPLNNIPIEFTTIFSNFVKYNNELINKCGLIQIDNEIKINFINYINTITDMFDFLINICGNLNKFVMHKDIFDVSEINNLTLT